MRSLGLHKTGRIQMFSALKGMFLFVSPHSSPRHGSSKEPGIPFLITLLIPILLDKQIIQRHCPMLVILRGHKTRLCRKIQGNTLGFLFLGGMYSTSSCRLRSAVFAELCLLVTALETKRLRTRPLFQVTTFVAKLSSRHTRLVKP